RVGPDTFGGALGPDGPSGMTRGLDAPRAPAMRRSGSAARQQQTCARPAVGGKRTFTLAAYIRAMLCLLDVPIFIDGSPQTSWGHANGQLDLPDNPARHDRISIPHGLPELVSLGLQDPTFVMGVSEIKGQPLVLFDGVVAPDELAAARAAWLL